MKKSRTGLVFVVIGLGLGLSCKSQNKPEAINSPQGNNSPSVKLFLCGDVMTGRGIDQALPQSVDPVLYESYLKDAQDYLRLAESENGKIQEPVPYDYIWGDALEVWKQNAPDLKLINLETSITTHGEPWPGKGIHYRMHPENVKIFTAAGIDHASLANNHTLDWGRAGLKETMETLGNAGILFSGVGENEQKAEKPSIMELDQGRVLVYSYGAPSSGIPAAWAADEALSGVNFLPNYSQETFAEVSKNVKSQKENGDIAIFSVHWGGNWGYDVSEKQQEFAHQLIDKAGVDVVFGHSSHHPMGVEVYNGKLIIYGAGDFINDYEGIGGHENYRGELTLMYFPEIDPNSGQLQALKMVPMEIKNFRLNRVSREDAEWLQERLHRESEKLGTVVRLDNENSLWLEW